MRAEATARWKRPPPPPFPPLQNPKKPALANPNPNLLATSLNSFRGRLAAGPPFSRTAKSFKSYAKTCVSLLRLCRPGPTTTLPILLTLHAHSLRSGLAADGSIATHLLTAYSAFALPADRDRAFGDAIDANANASSFSYNFMITERCKSGDLASARKLLDEMPERSVVAYTAVVDALMKQGRVRDAVKLYTNCPFRTVVSSTAMITGFVHNGLHCKALAVFLEMLGTGLRPNEVTFTCVIKACINACEFDFAMSIAGMTVKSNFFEKNVSVCNSLITLYLRMGDAVLARKMFDEMEERNVISWTALLDVYAEMGDLDGAHGVLSMMPERNEVSWATLIARNDQNGNATEAVKLFALMLIDGCRPNISSFFSVISACASLQDLRSGTCIHGHALKMGSDCDIFVASSLVDMYCKCEQCADGRRVFDLLPHENIVCWNSMIAGYSFNGKMEEAKQLFKQMPARNIASWNAIISACAENEHFVEALDSFDAMLASGQIPSQISFLSVIFACANLSYLEKGKTVHAKIVKLGIAEEAFIGTALTDMYANSGDLESSKRVFHRMPKRNEVTWTSMIQGLVALRRSLFTYLRKRETLEWHQMSMHF